MIWNGDRDIIYSRKKIVMFRLIGYKLFKDLLKRIYLDSADTLESFGIMWIDSCKGHLVCDTL